MLNPPQHINNRSLVVLYARSQTPVIDAHCPHLHTSLSGPSHRYCAPPLGSHTSPTLASLFSSSVLWPASEAPTSHCSPIFSLQETIAGDFLHPGSALKPSRKVLHIYFPIYPYQRGSHRLDTYSQGTSHVDAGDIYDLI